MAQQKKKSAPKVKGTRGPTKPIPKTRDAKGHLLKLTAADFPTTLDGKIAFCEYQIIKWSDRRAELQELKTPAGRVQAKLLRLRRQAAELERELKEANAGE